jgi:hypothetical protein
VSSDEEGTAIATARTQGEVLAAMSAGRKNYYVVGVGVGVGVGVAVVKLDVMQHLSACDGIAIFRISTNNCAIWPDSNKTPMQVDLFPTSSKFRLTWVGVQSSQRHQKLHIGWTSSPHSAISCTSPSTNTVG